MYFRTYARTYLTAAHVSHGARGAPDLDRHPEPERAAPSGSRGVLHRCRCRLAGPRSRRWALRLDLQAGRRPARHRRGITRAGVLVSWCL